MSQVSDPYARTEDRDGMRITWQQPIPDGKYPVILSYGDQRART
jgi:hypothetical protein